MSAYLLGSVGVADMDADARPNDWGEELLRNHPNEQMLQAMIMRLKRKTATDMEFKQYEMADWPMRAYLDMGGNAAAGDTILTVDDGSGGDAGYWFQEGTLICVGSSSSVPNLGTGEVMRVTRVVSGSQIEVERGYGGTAAAEIANNTILTNIGNASGEKSESPSSRSRTPSSVTNYMQIFQTPYDTTRVADLTKLRTGETANTTSRKDALLQHAKEREQAMLYGLKYSATTADGALYSTGGLARHFITTNKHDASGANFSKTNIYTWLSSMIGKGSKEKVALMGSTAKKCFQDFIRANGQYQLQAETRVYGFNVERFVSEGPTLLLAVHPLLTEVAPGDIIILDLPYLTFRFFSGCDFKRETVTLDNNPQVTKNQFYSICGLQCMYEEAHAYWYGITTYTNA